jgi:hypothetical protein
MEAIELRLDFPAPPVESLQVRFQLRRLVVPLPAEACYYVRNLARPLWFTQEDNRVDVLVGNPPWLAYRFMSDSMQKAYRKLSKARGLWAWGNVSTQQDLSDLFVVRAIEQYLRAGGQFGFVMPAAVLSRNQYEGFRTGYYEALGVTTAVAFSTPWDLRAVSPDPFPVPSSVVFGERKKSEPLPEDTVAFGGRIPHRSIRWAGAAESLETAVTKVERGSDTGRSPYWERFYNGATVFPRVLFAVRTKSIGPLGSPAGTQPVESVRSALEKEPWKSVAALDGLVEEQFIHRSYFGVNVAPFRLLDEVQIVIPWANGHLLDGTDEELDEYPHLAKWWRTTERLWERHRTDKTGNSLREQLDYYGKLSSQFPLRRHRVLYTKSGNRITASRIDDDSAVIDHTLYWAATASEAEGQYLTAILNSDAVHKKVEPLMAEGLFGKRHVKKARIASRAIAFRPCTIITRVGSRWTPGASASESDASELPGAPVTKSSVRSRPLVVMDDHAVEPGSGTGSSVSNTSTWSIIPGGIERPPPVTGRPCSYGVKNRARSVSSSRLIR